jgi:hypothetical protein
MHRQFDQLCPRTGWTRRRLLQAAGVMAATALAVPLRSKVVHGQPRFAADPSHLASPRVIRLPTAS